MVKELGFLKPASALVPETQIIQRQCHSRMVRPVGFLSRQKRDMKEFFGASVVIGEVIRGI